jgi:hypothetical protein
VLLVAGVPTRSYTVRAKTVDELAAEADAADRAAKGVSVAAAIPWLRAQADAGRAVTVTAGNAQATLTNLVALVAHFFDHFADLLESQGR